MFVEGGQGTHEAWDSAQVSAAANVYAVRTFIQAAPNRSTPIHKYSVNNYDGPIELIPYQ